VNFAAYQFWSSLAFGIGVAILCSLIAKFFFPKWRQDVEKCSFLLISLFLLYQESLTTLLAFLWVVVLGWFCIKNCKRSSPYLRHLWFVLLALQLAPLLYFKYWSFLIGEVFGLELEKLPALIPMGLSFYTFQKNSDYGLLLNRWKKRSRG